METISFYHFSSTLLLRPALLHWLAQARRAAPARCFGRLLVHNYLQDNGLETKAKWLRAQP